MGSTNLWWFHGKLIANTSGIEESPMRLSLILFSSGAFLSKNTSLRVSPCQFPIIKGCVYICQFDIITIYLITDDDIFELHTIASKCSCFISENILDLAKLLVDTNSMAFHTSVIDQTMHLFILVHGVPLKYLHELQWYDQTDWNVCTVQNKIWSEWYSWNLATVSWLTISQHCLKCHSL